MAPIAVALEQRVGARLLSAAGFFLFAVGLALSAVQSVETDFSEMFWPQVIRGCAIMFCLLPPTRLALGNLAAERVADASGLFNLMRNLGGAIGLALIDTVIYGRAPVYGAAIVARLEAGDTDTAMRIGISPELWAMRPEGPIDADTQAMLQPLVDAAALTQAINNAWAMVAALTIAALVCVPFARRAPTR
jgi:DHA2 family multidrug resistance protein